MEDVQEQRWESDIIEDGANGTWSRSDEEGWTELKMKNCWKESEDAEEKYEGPPSPPCPRSWKSSCKEGEVTAAASKLSCFLRETFIETRNVATTKLKWCYKKPYCCKFVLKSWKHIIFDYYESEVQFFIMPMNLSMSSMKGIHWFTNH